MAMHGNKISEVVNTEFFRDVKSGLTAKNKSLSSKYFYDKKGDELFVKIMNLPEYYLTRSEMEIFSEKSQEIAESFGVDEGEAFDLIELGAGDGTKTIHLLRYLKENGYDFCYKPIDISSNTLEVLKGNVQNELGEVNISPKQGEYFDVLSKFGESKKKKIILFLGSNLGNLEDDSAKDFFMLLSANLNEGDVVILGLDLIKPEEIVLPAYYDKQGITSEFNYNLLDRIKMELGIDMDRSRFRHVATYDESTGEVKSFLECIHSHSIWIDDILVNFEKNELIQTEISRKYNRSILHEILAGTNFEIVDGISDTKTYFTDFVLRKKLLSNQ